MSRRLLHVLVVLFYCLLTQSRAVALDKEDVRPQNLYTLDLRARLPNEKEFTDASLSLAVHVFRDPDAGRLFYVAANGKTLAVVAGGKDATDDGKKAPKRLHRLLLPVRDWDESTIHANTPKVGVEVYRDENSGNLIYVSHTGFVAVVRGPMDVTKDAKEPKSLGQLRLNVRQKTDDFAESILRCNVEVYRDENTGCLVYVGANGSLAVVAAGKAGEEKEAGEPVWDHAISSRVRAYGEEDFKEKTADFCAEVYLDENHGARIYVTENLNLAATAGGKAKEPDKVKPLAWEHRVRPKEAKAGGMWSAETFSNPNTGDRLLVTANGAVAVVGPGGAGPSPK
jgi:hypothetical protein